MAFSIRCGLDDSDLYAPLVVIGMASVVRRGCSTKISGRALAPAQSGGIITRELMGLDSLHHGRSRGAVWEPRIKGSISTMRSEGLALQH